MSEWTHGVAWSKSLETGNDAIDSQHKQLFKLTSDLVQACENDKGHEILEEALNFLASYTVRHFTDEEALQLEYKFPGYEAHKKLHDDFKAKAAELISQYHEDSDTAALSTKVNSVIIRWLLQHIKGEDFKIAAHIRVTGK